MLGDTSSRSRPLALPWPATVSMRTRTSARRGLTVLFADEIDAERSFGYSATFGAEDVQDEPEVRVSWTRMLQLHWKCVKLRLVEVVQWSEKLPLLLLELDE